MAMLGCRFTAQQRGWYVEESARDTFFNAAFAHQCEKSPLIILPASFFFFESVEHLLGWGEQELMLIVRVADDPQEVREIIAFGKTRKL